MIGIIAAVSSNGVIGQNGKLPFNYPEDLKHFKKLTLNSNVIMGRLTFESLGSPLPHRRNIIISSELSDFGFLGDPGSYEVQPNVACAIEGKLYMSKCPTWFIGGASIYQEGMKYADTIILTLTSDIINGEGLVRFPFINPSIFKLENIVPLETDNRLKIATYKRI